LFIIACMWVNDTMAYIVGSLIGKTPLTKISPKKTWEGTLGGMICAACIVGYAAYYFDEHEILQKSFFNWVVLSFVAALAGVWGDLFQSKLKRMAGVKDSGQFLPGHGGFLDRFDSLLLATPVVWIFLQFLH
ncbi:MAG: phosphatidate cytidylyltransferase, partial [Chitinophagaceae bacterium]|nr:phosphatidate cytidylyltransferase [Chitinophagaceae bacterium]